MKHEKGCAWRKADCSCGADPDVWFACGHCGKKTLLETRQHYGEDYNLCAPCSKEFDEHVRTCPHDWAPDPESDEWGERGRYCNRCSVFFTDDTAVDWFPYICDGFVDVPVA